MSTALTTRKQQNLRERFGETYGVEPSKVLEVLQQGIFRDFNAAEIMGALVIADQYSLNPFASEIYLMKTRGGVKPYIGVDGWAKIVNQNTDFDGCDFQYDYDGDDLRSVTCRVYHKRRQHPIEVTEFMEECVVDSSPVWKKSPKRFLRHRAFCQAARLAFGITGLKDEIEAVEIIEAEVVRPSAVPPRSGTEALKEKLRAREEEPEPIPSDDNEPEKIKF